MELFYRTYGTLQGRTVVILHGWLGMSGHWHNIARFLATKGFRVVVPDLPDHGRSFHTDFFSYEGMARCMDDFLRSHTIGKPILVGHSMGGKIAMKMVDLYGDVYDRLVIVDILPRVYPWLMEKGSVADVILNTDLESFSARSQLYDHFRQNSVGDGWLALLMQNIRMETDETGKAVFRWRSNACMLAKNMFKVAGGLDLSGIYLPTLLIRGDRSEFTREEDIGDFGVVFKNGSIVTVADSGHWVFVDNTEGFLECLMNYLN